MMTDAMIFTVMRSLTGARETGLGRAVKAGLIAVLSGLGTPWRLQAAREVRVVHGLLTQ